MKKLKPGDVVKCTKCKAYHRMFLCGNCDELHPEHANARDDVTEVAMKWYVCPNCGTHDEVMFLRKNMKAQQAGMLN